MALAGLRMIFAALFLTKINVGVFFGLAIGVAMLAFCEGRNARIFWLASAIVGSFVPFVLTSRLFYNPWAKGTARNYCGRIVSGRHAQRKKPDEGNVSMEGLRHLVGFGADFGLDHQLLCVPARNLTAHAASTESCWRRGTRLASSSGAAGNLRSGRGLRRPGIP